MFFGVRRTLFWHSNVLSFTRIEQPVLLAVRFRLADLEVSL